MKVFLLSSVVPKDTSAGEITYYRHFRAAGNINLLVASHGTAPEFAHRLIPMPPLFRCCQRMARTRWSCLGSSAAACCPPGTVRTAAKILEEFSPDIIMTVAHGDLWRLAHRLARCHNKPLVTIFADWWPDIAPIYDWVRPRVEREFRALHRESAVSLCICEGMLKALGNTPGATVLYPIPTHAFPTVAQEDCQRESLHALRILYAGNLYHYGPMLGRVLDQLRGNPRVRLEVRGCNPNWPQRLREQAREDGTWLEFAPRQEFNAWLESADAFLVAMEFEAAMRRRAQTSFPSKLLEYAQFGKPLVIWGPEYCSAVQWARQGNRALCVTHEDPAVLVAEMESLAGSPAEQQRLSEQARRAAQTDFNPDTIQKQFEEALQRAV